ncbi:MAG: hypothetical protein K6F05_04895 [Succinivibrio sp.]|nr:hypothetical protein [Succinivibrio sp.]
MFYIDEMRLRTEYCRILQKLFIFRDFDSIPAELNPFTVIDRLFTVQSLAILSQPEQQVVLKLLTALPKLMKILRTREPSLQTKAQALLPANLRAFLSVLFEVAKNRGSYRGGEREFDAKRLYLVRQDHASRVLAWALRELKLCLHPDFPPDDLSIASFETALRRHYQELGQKNPDSQGILEEWHQQFDRVKFIALHEHGNDQVSAQLYDELSPESLILLLFLSRLQNKTVARVTKRQQERALNRQEIVYIFTNLHILQDPANPPYGLSMQQAMHSMFKGDLSALDERAQEFLSARKLSLQRYETLLQMDDLQAFVKEFAKLEMADQIFLSALQSIDKFYNEHGRFAPHDDYWYSSMVYTSQNIFYMQRPQDSVPVSQTPQPEVRPQAAQTAQSVSSDNPRQQGIEEARRNTLSILEELGLIQDAMHPTPSYDIATLCRALFSEELISHLPPHDALFVSERTRSISLYQVLQNVSDEQQQKFFSSLQESDAGFLLALRSLDDRFYDIDADTLISEPEHEPAPDQVDYQQLIEPLEKPKAELLNEATPYGGIDFKAEDSEAVDVEKIDSDPERAAQRVWSVTTTQGICRMLELSYAFEDVECTQCASLRDLLDELFTLESFVRLDKQEQLFLLERKQNLPRFISYVIEHDPKVKMGIYLTLEPYDQGFVSYVSALKFRKK